MDRSFLSQTLDALRAKRQGLQAIELRQRRRLADMVAFARANSPYYRELYQGLPHGVDESSLLPVTSKEVLMSRFDDWVTDREVTLEGARAFVGEPENIGSRFLGKYLLAVTSGTTGLPGIFVLDDAWWNTNAVLSTRMMMTWLSAGEFTRILTRGMRTATPIATGGHFIQFASTRRQNKGGSKHAQTHRIFPVDRPLPELVSGLNDYSPVILKGYTSVISLLAREQEAGRLRIGPVLVLTEAERMDYDEFIRIAEAFKCKVRSQYGSTEAGVVAYGCSEGWLHVNSDWVDVEPVDADYRPTPQGEQSHTVLISNLANRVQPILRYDLGDSVLQRPDPCPCGDPLPAIRVQGRAADVLYFHAADDEQIAIPPIALSSRLDRVSGIELFQVVQTTPNSLSVRLRTEEDADAGALWRQAQADVLGVLRGYGLDDVDVERAAEQPERSPGGKYREVIPLR